MKKLAIGIVSIAFALVGCSKITMLRTEEMQAVGADVKGNIQMELDSTMAKLSAQNDSLRAELDSLKAQQEAAALVQKRMMAEVTMLSRRMGDESERNDSRQEEIIYRLDMLLGKSDKILAKKEVVREPLMEGMAQVYRLFAEGKLFFPQVEKSVAVLKRAVSALLPAIESERKSAAAPSARVVLASVDFGIHDIGKEILAEFFPCFGFSVTDLGCGCSCEKIVEVAYREQPDVVWLSGLFVSSLDKMVGVAKEFRSQGIEIPLVLGGVSTSAMHTAAKVAPEAVGPVVYVSDPGKSVLVAEALIDTSKRGPFFDALEAHQEKLRDRYKALLQP